MQIKLEKYIEAAKLVPGNVIIFQLEDDNSMKVFFYSHKAMRMTGMCSEELDSQIGSDGFNMILEDDHKIILEKIKACIDNKEELDVIYRQHHRIHGIVWIHMNASIVDELEGKPIFLATMLDVTNEMHNSTSLLEAAASSVCVIEKNTKLLLYGNSNFYKLINSTRADCLGVYCYEALCGNTKYKNNDQCLCFSTIDMEKPFEYYNPVSKQYLSMYGRKIMWGEHEAYVFFLQDQTQEKYRDQQLKNAQERFEMTLDNSGLFIWEYDMVNHRCLNSRKAVRDYGIPLIIDNYPESLYEMGHTPPETIEQIKDVKRRLYNGESGFSVERRTVDAKGNSQWMRVSYTLQTDSAGKPLRALVCGTDISEQKKKEAAYEEELRLKTMVGGNTSILAILNITKDKLIENRAENKALADILNKGGTVNELMHHVSDFFIASYYRNTYCDSFNRERMLNDFSHGILHRSLRHQFTNISGWYESSYDLLQNPYTGDVEAIASLKDVTAEVRSQQIVNKLASLDFDVILTQDLNTGDVFVFTGANDTGTFGTKDTMTRYEQEFHKMLHQCCTPQEAERVIKETHRECVLARLKEVPLYTVTYTLNVNGNIKRKRSIYTYLNESKKTVLYARQDITESYLLEEKQKRALAEALEKAEIANRAKTSFLSRVSHDMRTPLNGVLGLTALMKDEVQNTQVLNDLKQLELSGKYLLDLINDVLDVSSIEAGKLQLHPTISTGRDIFENILKLVRPNMEAKNIEFILNCGELSSTPAYMDEARLQQVAINILGNAVKFTPEGGRVELTVRTLSEENGISLNEMIVTDNGVGMDEEFLPHLFESFTQENASTTNNKNGTGLGMAITKKIVELMNGTIKVTSKKNVGTTVTITLKLPMATQEELQQQKKQRSAPTVVQYQLDGKRVLLCEDHPLNRQIATRLLTKVGVIVECAENGALGVEKFKNSPENYYDAILMDVRMPVMDGLDATRAIRKLDRRDVQKLPILAMTANALDEDVRNTRQAGMNSHLSKPVNREELYQVLNSFINRL